MIIFLHFKVAFLFAPLTLRRYFADLISIFGDNLHMAGEPSLFIYGKIGNFYPAHLFIGIKIYTRYRAGRDDITTGKLFPSLSSLGECLGLYPCVLIIFKRK